MALWKDLRAQGVHRCSAMFKDGTQCRRRAVAEHDNSWCAKHGQIMQAHTDAAIRALGRQARRDSKS